MILHVHKWFEGCNLHAFKKQKGMSGRVGGESTGATPEDFVVSLAVEQATRQGGAVPSLFTCI